MHTIRMPRATKTMDDGTVVRWYKQEGAAVEEGEALLVIETVDSGVEVASGASGTLRKILLPAGTSAPVDSPIALIGKEKAKIDKALKAAEKEIDAIAALWARAREEAARPAPVTEKKTTPKGKPAGAPEPEVATAVPVEQKTEEEKQVEKETPAAAPGGAVVPILMPQAGQSMEEGTIVAWRVKPGDAVAVGQIVFDVETDKATVEVEAVDAGRLAKIVVEEGETIEVKKPVAYIADNDADVEAYLASQAAAAPAAEAVTEETTPRGKPTAAPTAPAAPAVVEGGRVKASPAARKVAAQRGIDLRTVGRGSGPGWRILSTDVETASNVASGPVRRKMTSMRKAIARNLSYSKQTIPHFYARLTIDGEAMFAFYRGEKAKYPCTLNDVVTLACGRAIRELPAMRSQIEEDEIVEYPSANIGIAVGREDGLVVPVVMGVDRMSLQELGAEARRLIDNAREGKLENMGQGVFTITNLGMFGVEEFSAIINPPEAAILAVSALREDVVVRDGAMRPGKVMTMTLSTDHRIVDGLVAAQFLSRLKELLEDPAQLA